MVDGEWWIKNVYFLGGKGVVNLLQMFGSQPKVTAGNSTEKVLPSSTFEITEILPP
jgi:hypothetical protein